MNEFFSSTINKNSHIVKIKPHKKSTNKVLEPVPTNHIVVIDCSGSMYGELPKIRTQLKKKLPKLLAEKDTLSIIWFSGKKEFGVLIENEPVSTLKDLTSIEKAIDRWLKPIGLTGFKEPILEVKKLANKISSSRPGSVNSLFFMSDGCDNQWPKADIINAVSEASDVLASATIVEYGYYADRQLLTSIAEKSGGALIFAEDFDKYEPVFENAMARKTLGTKKIEIEIPTDVIGGFAYALSNNDIFTFGLDENKIKVPEDIEEVYYLSQTATGSQVHISDMTPAVYAAISLFAGRMNSDVVWSLLKTSGDVKFIDEYSNCFGKQKYSDFMELARKAVVDESYRLVNGFDQDRVPDEDSFTVLDFLKILSSNKDNKVLLDNEAFVYNKIGRSRVDSNTVLTSEEQAQIEILTEEMKSTKDLAKIKEINESIAAITNKPAALKFESTPSPEGYSVSNLTYNEDRPNISILIRKEGIVDLSARLTPEMRKVPIKFPSFIYRNYTIIKDGLVNVKYLPVRLSDGDVKFLKSVIENKKAPSDAFIFKDNGDLIVRLEKLPVINRNMVKSLSAKDLFSKSWSLLNAQAYAKVFNTIKKELFAKKSEGYAIVYGEQEAIWLKEQGFTDYSGFSPKSVAAESTDFYVGKELKVSMKGYSSLPSLKDVKDRMVKNNVTAPGKLMEPAIKMNDEFLKSQAYTEARNKDAAYQSWLNEKIDHYSDIAKNLIREISQITFTTILGQVWFSEFKSLDENTIDMDFDGTKVQCKVEMRDIEVKI